MYFNEEGGSGEEECNLKYKEDDENDDDNEEDENEKWEWYKISDRNFSPDLVLPLYVAP